MRNFKNIPSANIYMTKNKISKKTIEMTDIFLVSIIASLLTGVVICTFIFLIITAQPEQLGTVYWTSIAAILFISTVAAIQYSFVNR